MRDEWKKEEIFKQIANVSHIHKRGNVHKSLRYEYTFYSTYIQFKLTVCIRLCGEDSVDTIRDWPKESAYSS